MQAPLVLAIVIGVVIAAVMVLSTLVESETVSEGLETKLTSGLMLLLGLAISAAGGREGSIGLIAAGLLCTGAAVVYWVLGERFQTEAKLKAKRTIRIGLPPLVLLVCFCIVSAPYWMQLRVSVPRTPYEQPYYGDEKYGEMITI